MKRILLAAALVLGITRSASVNADTITVGLFAPSEPFPSTTARVELATKLGAHVGKALGATGVGRNYARASDFAAAVKKGEVTLAVVDAAYLASAGGNFAVIAASVRGGETSHAWGLVARAGRTISELKDKRVLVASTGGREPDLVLNVLLGGEIARDFFGKIQAAPDTVSALAALGLGKAEAAVVPAGVELPAGTAVILALPALPGSLFVAYGTFTAAQRAALISAASSFKGDATVGVFRGVEGDAVKNVARRFTVAVKRGPLAVPTVRVLVGDLVEGRSFAIERTPVTTFAIAPPR